MLEPIQGEGGIYEAGQEYLKGVKELCKKHGLLLIFDEVQCGLGRTGAFFAYQHYGIEPDICTLAKSLGSGFPIGAMIATEEVAGAFLPGNHASTFGGNPLACAAALAAMQFVLENNVMENAARVGGYFKTRLEVLSGQFPFITEVRGRGLMLGADLTPGSADGQEVVAQCQENGLLINCIDGHILRFLPPLIISESDIDEAAGILAGVLKKLTGK